MATKVEECRQIVEETERSGLTYMMMETVILQPGVSFSSRKCMKREKWAKLQFPAGPATSRKWQDGRVIGKGLPPMHYATHCVGPVLALPKGQAEYVSCFGSGRIDENLIEKYGSPFAIETCHIK